MGKGTTPRVKRGVVIGTCIVLADACEQPANSGITDSGGLDRLGVMLNGAVCPRRCDQCVKRCWIVDSDFAEHLAIQQAARAGQAVDEQAVLEAAHPARRGDAGDPELTVVAAAQAAVTPHVAQGAHDSNLGLLLEAALGSVVTASFAEEFAASLGSGCALACTWHGVSSVSCPAEADSIGALVPTDDADESTSAQGDGATNKQLLGGRSRLSGLGGIADLLVCNRSLFGAESATEELLQEAQVTAARVARLAVGAQFSAGLVALQMATIRGLESHLARFGELDALEQTAMGLLLRHGDRSSVSAGGRLGGGSGKIPESPLADNGLSADFSLFGH